MRILAKTIACALCATQLSAAPVTLSCVMDELANSGGWIPTQPVVKYDLETKSVELLEPSAEVLNGTIDPRWSKVTSAKPDRIVLRWHVAGTTSSTGQRAAAFRFSARYNPQTGDVIVIAKPQGYRNQFTASGTCEQV